MSPVSQLRYETESSYNHKFIKFSSLDLNPIYSTLTALGDTPFLSGDLCHLNQNKLSDSSDIDIKPLISSKISYRGIF